MTASPSLPRPHTSSAADAVQAFYEELPFNYEASASGQAAMIRAANQIEAYPPLASLLSSKPGLSVLDAGCGAGWFVNTAARYYRCEVTGVDFCGKAIERAVATADELGVREHVRFVTADLFQVPTLLPRESFDVLNSLGVLHHTRDARDAFCGLVPLLRPGGFVHLGLYHRYGRWPLMEMFRPVRDAITSASSPEEAGRIEEDGFEAWKALHDPEADPVFQRSWYRDQCLHPHETQWTLQEVLGWFDACDIEPLCCSLDRFASNPDWRALVADEHTQEARAYVELYDNSRFFPGFFVLWGRKRDR